MLSVAHGRTIRNNNLQTPRAITGCEHDITQQKRRPLQGETVAGSSTLTDNEIIDRILQGKVNDFERLLDRYQGYICTLISRQLPAEMVLDLAHEVFVEAYRSLPQYQQDKPLKNWLAGIALHRCHDYWRRQYRRREIPASALSEDQQHWLETVAAGESRDNAFARERQQEILELLHLALADLPPKDRMVLVLVHLEGLSVKEVAAMLDWSIINVKVRAHRARKAMRKRITTLLHGDTWS